MNKYSWRVKDEHYELLRDDDVVATSADGLNVSFCNLEAMEEVKEAFRAWMRLLLSDELTDELTDKLITNGLITDELTDKLPKQCPVQYP